MNTEISRFMNTQAMREVDCPRCISKANVDCVQPSGRKANIHAERIKAYLEKIGPDEAKRRHTFKAHPLGGIGK